MRTIHHSNHTSFERLGINCSDATMASIHGWASTNSVHCNERVPVAVICSETLLIVLRPWFAKSYQVWLL